MIEPDLTRSAGPVPHRMLRQFAALWLVIFLALAGWQGLARGHETAGLVLAAVAVTVGLLGLLKPEAIRPLFVGLIAITFPIGWVVSHALMTMLLYLVFTPIGLFFRLIGRDALRFKPRRDDPTYWLHKKSATDLASYLRQS
jgi:hypothetical protein